MTEKQVNYCSNCPRIACLATKGVLYCSVCFRAYQKGRDKEPSTEVLDCAINYLYKLVGIVPWGRNAIGTIRALEAALERREGK